MYGRASVPARFELCHHFFKSVEGNKGVSQPGERFNKRGGHGGPLIHFKEHGLLFLSQLTHEFERKTR